MQFQDRISILEAEVKRLKDAELQHQSTTEPRNEYEGVSPTRAYQQSPLCPCSHTGGAAEIHDDERGELQLDSPREHAAGGVEEEHGVDGNNLPPSVVVGGVEEEHAGDGNSIPMQQNDGESYDTGGEDVVDRAANPTSTIITRVKNNPRTRNKSVSTRSPYETRTYKRMKKRKQ